MAVCTHEQLMWCVVVTVALLLPLTSIPLALCCQPTKKRGLERGGEVNIAAPRLKDGNLKMYERDTHSVHANEVW